MAKVDHKKKLLIVEDSVINQQLLVMILKDDYETVTANNGREALDILCAKDGHLISAVILDIVMPVMDGFEVLRRMRENKALAQIPVIVASGGDVEGGNKEIQALSQGANDYVRKPYKPDIIKHRVANAIYLRETASFINTVQHDSLTGLYSKEYFYNQAEEIMQRDINQDYDIICCDIERFKLVNDLYGAKVGDDLLNACADIFRDRSDNYIICGRTGPDIFAFLLKHIDDYSNFEFSSLDSDLAELGINLNIQLRHGIYMVEDKELPVSIMCDRACIAASSIKGIYGVSYKIYDEKMRQKTLDEQFIISNMKRALKNGQFKVHFQPKYSLKTERIVSAEALVRWEDPDRGLIFPGDFIPLFERNGFITDLDIYVWDTCCKRIRQWLDDGNKIVPVSVNVSRTDIYDPNLDKILLSLIRKYDLSPEYLRLEITESAYTHDSDQLIEAIWKLKRLGFTIEMDDFGTGYSSLNMLAELPIDVLKLDIRFMQSQHHKNSRNILSFIVSLAKLMDLTIVAEGTETIEQVELLRNLNCDVAQGFYFARPMEIKAFEDLLRKQAETYSADDETVEEITEEQNCQIDSAILEMKTRTELDCVTGLLNRVEVENRIQNFFYENNEPTGVFIVADIDGFKNINGVYGHEAGDALLKILGHMLSELFTETAVIGRIGGDEFAVQIPYIPENADLESKLNRLCSPINYDGMDKPIHFSAGVCVTPDDGTDFQTLYDNARMALLRAKYNGKGNYLKYETDMVPPIDEYMENRISGILDSATEAVFVSDAATGEIIYISEQPHAAIY